MIAKHIKVGCILSILLISGLIIPLNLIKTNNVCQNSHLRVWITEGYNSSMRLTEIQKINTSSNNIFTSYSIRVDESRRFQQVEGFGAALTDSAAFLLRNRLNTTEYQNVMDNLFHPQKGIGISFLRITMGSSDYSRDWATYDDTASDLTDFSIRIDEEAIIPVLKDVLERNPNIRIIATPWSAPGWMKLNANMAITTTKGLIGGSLNLDFYDLYADYFILFLQAYLAHNITIFGITPQNEPYYAPQDYPGMLMNYSEQAAFIKVLAAKLSNAKLDTRIIVHDHNWDLANELKELISDRTIRKYIDGIAWHGYSSPPDPTIQSKIKAQFPKSGWYDLTYCSKYR